jgi:hypothetical protein
MFIMLIWIQFSQWIMCNNLLFKKYLFYDILINYNKSKLIILLKVIN